MLHVDLDYIWVPLLYALYCYLFVLGRLFTSVRLYLVM